jgi:hypothetical protein
MSPRAHAIDPARLAQWCMEHLGSPPAVEIFKSGYLSAVIGLRLADDREVVVKVRPDSTLTSTSTRWPVRSGSTMPGAVPVTGCKLASPDAVIGHCDWLAGNLRWSGDALLVVHDWDSMTADSEAVLAGFAAALYSTVNADELATVEETERFLVEYCHARGVAGSSARTNSNGRGRLASGPGPMTPSISTRSGSPSPHCPRMRPASASVVMGPARGGHDRCGAHR